MYQVAGAVLISASFVVQAIYYCGVFLQRAVVDTHLSGPAAQDKYMTFGDKTNYPILFLLGLGSFLMLIGIVGSLLNLRRAAKT